MSNDLAHCLTIYCVYVHVFTYTCTCTCIISPSHYRAKLYKMQFKKELKFDDMVPPVKEPDNSGKYAN